MGNVLFCKNCDSRLPSDLKFYTKTEYEQLLSDQGKTTEETKHEFHNNEKVWICESCHTLNPVLSDPQEATEVENYVPGDTSYLNKKVELFLKKKGYSPADATLLSGGFANFTYRVAPSNSTETKVIKHAEPYVAFAPSIPLPLERSKYEYLALKTLKDKLDPCCQVPEVYNYDAETNCILMQDCGSKNLKSYEGSDDKIKTIGENLGAWLYSLHNCKLDVPLRQDGLPAAMYRYCTYSRLTNVTKKYDLDPSFYIAIDQKYGKKIITDQERSVLCHGDFWTGNVIINDEGVCMVVDWEVVRRGTGATDVGQFAAEAYLIHKKHGDNAVLLKSFLESYVLKAKPSKEFVKDALVHLGVHLFYWPSEVSWGSEEFTKEIIFYGAEVIKQADAENWSYFVGGPFENLVSAHVAN